MDGSAAGSRALEWAAIRAHAGDHPLRIVYVVRSHAWLDPYGFMVAWDFEPLEEAQQVLDEAVRTARRQVPLVQISTRLRDEEAATALLSEGRTAALIVLGQREWRRGPAWLCQPLSTRVARRARGRVVIVGPDNEILP